MIGTIPCSCNGGIAFYVSAVGQRIEQHEGASQVRDALVHSIVCRSRCGVAEDILHLHLVLIGGEGTLDTVFSVTWQHVLILFKLNDSCLYLLPHQVYFFDFLAAFIAFDDVIFFQCRQLGGDGDAFRAVNGKVNHVCSYLQGIKFGRLRGCLCLKGKGPALLQFHGIQPLHPIQCALGEIQHGVFSPFNGAFYTEFWGVVASNQHQGSHSYDGKNLLHCFQIFLQKYGKRRT